MKTTLAKLLVAAGVGVGGFALLAEAAQAMPSVDPGVGAAAAAGAQVEQARWVCGPYRCWWRPDYWGPRPYWRPHPYWGPRPWGWRRGW